MTRQPASIVVTAGSWLEAQPAVDRLQSRLGVRDELLVAIADEFGVPSAKHGSVRVVMGAADVVRDDAERAACHDLVVFIDCGLSPTGHWLDALLAPFESEDVIAAGPRIVGAKGEQGVDMPEGLRDNARRDFARDWSRAHRGEVTEASDLSERCIAVRRGTAHGRRVLAHAALVDVPVAVTNGATAVAATAMPVVERDGPLVSLCMIVKNEEETLSRCLNAVRGLVDEMVVYDTGSIDNTIAIGRAAGATVIEGSWVDDFAAVRNAALEHCTGEWILWVDADDILTGDRDSFRAVLATSPPVDTISLTIDNIGPDGSSVDHSHPAARVFRRERAHWKGRLHETIEPRPGVDELRVGYTAHIHLLHTGYAAEVVAAKAKSERNIRLAEAELADGTDRRSLVTIHLGRSLASAGRLDEALARFEEALEMTEDPAERRVALRHGAEALIDTDRPVDALAWIERLRDVSKKPDMADYLEGVARANAGETDAAIDILLGLLVVRDDDGFVIPDHVLRMQRALLLKTARRWSEVADELLAIVSDDMAPPWALLFEANWRAGRDADEVAAIIPSTHLTNALTQLLTIEPTAADGYAEAVYQRWGEDVAVLAVACALAPKLPLTRSLEWSARLRQAGLGDQCPLLAIATDGARSASDRVQAACVASGAFGDERATDAMRCVAPDVPETDFVQTLIHVDELAPELLPHFVLGAATDPERTLRLADALEALGAADVAADLRAHASA